MTKGDRFRKLINDMSNKELVEYMLNRFTECEILPDRNDIECNWAETGCKYCLLEYFNQEVVDDKGSLYSEK